MACLDEQQVGYMCFLFSIFPLMKLHYVGKHFNEMHTGNKQKLLVNYTLTASLVCNGLNTVLNTFIIGTLMIKSNQNAFGPSYSCIKA